METKLIKTILTAGLLLSQMSYGAVWETTKQWDMEEELKYSEWVEDSWHSGVFKSDDSPYYGIITDCADAGYTMRMIYAYENGLPFEIYSRRIKKVVSNQTTRFDRNQDDQLESLLIGLKAEHYSRAKRDWESFDIEKKKFFLFQRLISGLTSTWTLPQDTYTPKLGKGNIRAGMLQLKRRAHTYTIKRIDRYGNLKNLNSTMPPRVRWLSKSTGLQVAPTSNYEDGILAFRWPEEAKKPSHLVRRNSIQQQQLYRMFRENYDKSQSFFKLAALIKYGDGENIEGLSTEKEPYDRSVPRAYKAYCQYFQDRVAAVESAREFREDNDGRCMTESEYDNYSTPSRDKKMKEKFIALANLYKEAMEDGEWDDIDYSIRAPIEKILHLATERSSYDEDWLNSGLFTYVKENVVKRYRRKDPSCFIRFKGDKLHVSTYTDLLLRGLVSSNPNDMSSARWGLYPANNSCPQF